MWTHGALLAAIDDRRALLSRLNHPSGALAGLSKQCLDASPLLATVRKTAGVYPILFPIWISLLSSEDSALRISVPDSRSGLFSFFSAPPVTDRGARPAIFRGFHSAEFF